MAKCNFCGSVTELFDNGVPICVACSKERAIDRETPETLQEIRNTLLHDTLEATARHNEAREEFEAIMGHIPSGLPATDGAQRIKNASSTLSIARRGMMEAHARLDKFLESGIVPEDLHETIK